MKALFIILFLFILIHGNAQSIVAGEFNGNDFYFDYVPDYILFAPEPLNFSSDSLTIDLNNDGIDDVIIDVANHDGGNWFNKRHAEIIPINNSQIALATLDTCFANCPPPDYVSFEAVAQAFAELDEIDETSTWIDSAAYLSFEKWEAAIPNGCGYACTGGNFDFEFSYVGVRIFAANDTLYGWIKVRLYSTAPSDLNLAIGSFACNVFVVGLREYCFTKKRLVGIMDILGRKSEDIANTILIYQYSDGTTEKVFNFD